MQELDSLINGCQTFAALIMGAEIFQVKGISGRIFAGEIDFADDGGPGERGVIGGKSGVTGDETNEERNYSGSSHYGFYKQG